MTLKTSSYILPKLFGRKIKHLHSGKEKEDASHKVTGEFRVKGKANNPGTKRLGPKQPQRISTAHLGPAPGGRFSSQWAQGSNSRKEPPDLDCQGPWLKEDKGYPPSSYQYFH